MRSTRSKSGRIRTWRSSAWEQGRGRPGAPAVGAPAHLASWRPTVPRGLLSKRREHAEQAAAARPYLRRSCTSVSIVARSQLLGPHPPNCTYTVAEWVMNRRSFGVTVADQGVDGEFHANPYVEMIPDSEPDVRSCRTVPSRSTGTSRLHGSCPRLRLRQISLVCP
jgi:hypothetical protein